MMGLSLSMLAVVVIAAISWTISARRSSNSSAAPAVEQSQASTTLAIEIRGKSVDGFTMAPVTDVTVILIHPC